MHFILRSHTFKFGIVAKNVKKKIQHCSKLFWVSASFGVKAVLTRLGRLLSRANSLPISPIDLAQACTISMTMFLIISFNKSSIQHLEVV